MYPFLVAILFSFFAAVAVVTNSSRDIAERLTSHADQVTVDFYAYKKAVQNRLCEHGLHAGVIPDEELTAELGKSIAGTPWHHYISDGNIYFYVEDTEGNRHVSAGFTDRSDVSVAVSLDTSRHVRLLNGNDSGIAVPEAIPANSVIIVVSGTQNCLINSNPDGSASLSDGTILDLCGHKLTTSDGHVITYDSNSIGVDGYIMHEGQVTSDGIRIAGNGQIFTQSHSITMSENGMTIDGVRYEWTVGDNCVTKPSTELPELPDEDGDGPEAPQGGEEDGEIWQPPSDIDTGPLCIGSYCGSDGGGDIDNEPDTPLDAEDTCEEVMGGIWNSSTGTCTLPRTQGQTDCEDNKNGTWNGDKKTCTYTNKESKKTSITLSNPVVRSSSSRGVVKLYHKGYVPAGSVSFGKTYQTVPKVTGYFNIIAPDYGYKSSYLTVDLAGVITVTKTGFSWSGFYLSRENHFSSNAFAGSTIVWTVNGVAIEQYIE